MDFAFTETQQAIRGMFKKIFSELSTDDHLKSLDREGRWFHAEVWEALARGEMLGIAIPEAYGGAGLGLVELCLLLHQAGRSVARIPALSTLVMGALPIAEFGSEEQKRRFLPEVASGARMLTASLFDQGSAVATAPATRAVRDAGGWSLSGVRSAVPGLDQASHALIPARTGEGTVGVFIVDLEAEGLSVNMQRLTNDEPVGQVVLEGVHVSGADVLGDPFGGSEVVAWMVQRATLGVCALGLGVAEGALFMTANYVGQRQQFGVSIGSFQAVSQRAGDAYIDVEAMKVSLWQAAWCLEQGSERAARALAIAKFWASEGGHRVVAAAQHLHGGMGFDRDYPLHRYFLTAKRLEFTLGGASTHLAALGDMVAGEAG